MGSQLPRFKDYFRKNDPCPPVFFPAAKAARWMNEGSTGEEHEFDNNSCPGGSDKPPYPDPVAEDDE